MCEWEVKLKGIPVQQSEWTLLIIGYDYSHIVYTTMNGFHVIHGSDVTLSENRREVVARQWYTSNTVFSNQCLGPGDTFTVKVTEATRQEPTMLDSWVSY